MPEITYREALRQALRWQLQNDERVFLMGEDIGAYGGSYAVTKGFLEEFGRERVKDTPIAESVDRRRRHRRRDGRPEADGRADDDQLQPARHRPDRQQRLEDATTCRTARSTCRWSSAWPAARAASSARSTRTASRAGTRTCPGSRSSCPATPYDAKGLLMTAFDDDNPVIFIEHTALYASKGEVPEEPYRDPVRQGRRHARRRATSRSSATAAASTRRSAPRSSSPSEGIEAEVLEPAHAQPARHRRHPRVRAQDEPRDRRRGRLAVRRLRRRDRRHHPGARVRRPRCARAALLRRRRPDALQRQRSSRPRCRRRPTSSALREGDGAAMISEVVMPQMGADMTEGTLVSGSSRRAMRSSAARSSPRSRPTRRTSRSRRSSRGVFRKALAHEGDVVDVGGLIAVIAAADDDISKYENGASRPPKGRSAAAPNAAGTAQDEPPRPHASRSGDAKPAQAQRRAAAPAERPTPSHGQPQRTAESAAPDGDGRAASASRPSRAASPKRTNIDIRTVRGTGPDGRIVNATSKPRQAGRAVARRSAPAPAPATGAVARPRPPRHRRCARRSPAACRRASARRRTTTCSSTST